MTKDFKQAWWLAAPHLQTLFPYLFRRRSKIVSRRERLELPDGDFLDLDWVGEGDGPIVIVMHGLSGSVKSHYARGTLSAIARTGARAVLMHFRGCSGEANRLARCYHSGETGDFGTVLNRLLQREPHTAISAVGFSLGGNVLLKALGEGGVFNNIKSAVAISVPFDLAASVKNLSSGFARIYQWSLIRQLKREYKKKFKMSLLPGIKTFWEFDNIVTAPLHGFAGADDYYKKSSSKQYLAKIEVPTLILHAKDDPFSTPCSIPDQSCVSDKITLNITEHGGHVGFVAGKYPWKPEYWLEQAIVNYLGLSYLR